MNRIGLAFRAFFGVLGNAEKATAVESALSDSPTPTALIEKPKKPEKPTPPPKPAPVQNAAVTFLCALQREARFVDFLKESLDSFSDAQVGAVCRDVHRDAGAVVERFFSVQPLDDAHKEGDKVELASDYDPSLYRLSGAVAGANSTSGTLQHHGWKATRCELPKWTGTDSALLVVAPAEIEVKNS